MAVEVCDEDSCSHHRQQEAESDGKGLRIIYSKDYSQ